MKNTILLLCAILLSCTLAQQMLQANMLQNQLEVQMGEKFLRLSLNPLLLTIIDQDDPQETYAFGFNKLMQITVNQPNVTNIEMHPNTLIDGSTIQYTMGQPQMLQGNTVLNLDISGIHSLPQAEGFEILRLNLVVNGRNNMILMNMMFNNFTNLWLPAANTLGLWFNLERKGDRDAMREMNEIQQMGFNMINPTIHPEDGRLLLAKNVNIGGQLMEMYHLLRPVDDTRSELMSCLSKFEQPVTVPFMIKFESDRRPSLIRPGMGQSGFAAPGGMQTGMQSGMQPGIQGPVQQRMQPGIQQAGMQQPGIRQPGIRQAGIQQAGVMQPQARTQPTALAQQPVIG